MVSCLATVLSFTKKLATVLYYNAIQYKKWRIMRTKGIHGWVSIDTLDQPSTDTPLAVPQSTLDWNSINTLIDTQLTLAQNLSWQSTCLISIDAYELVYTWPTIDWLLIKCWSSVNRVLIELSIEYQSRCWLRVLIEGIDQQSIEDAISTQG